MPSFVWNAEIASLSPYLCWCTIIINFYPPTNFKLAQYTKRYNLSHLPPIYWAVPDAKVTYSSSIHHSTINQDKFQRANLQVINNVATTILLKYL